MAENKSGDPSKKAEPVRDNAAPAAEANPNAPRASGDGTADKRETTSQEGTLMSAAVYNFLIAQQYIDGTKFPPEYKLVCFHYAISLLAAYRNDRAKRVLASQFLAAASAWEAGDEKDLSRKQAIDRIVCESHYNLGVIEELNGEFLKARTSYTAAVEIASNAAHPERFINVTLLARLGEISSEFQAIRKDVGARNRTEFTGDQVQGSDITGDLQSRIGTTQSRIRELGEQIRELQVQRKHRILGEIEEKLKRFQDELDQTTPRPRAVP